MKRKMRTTVYSLMGVALLLPSVGLANVCSQGVGIPPFLSSGAKPNLLMVLDNSGSMLDSAYTDATSFCFDDTYDVTKTYGGYFVQDKWYKWSDGDFDPWKNGKAYVENERVYVNGIIWEVEEGGGGTSNGQSLATDVGVAWEKVFTLNKWANNTVYDNADYPLGIFLWSGPQLYYSASGGTSNDPDISNGFNLADDIGITDWVPVDSTWLNGQVYTSGDIVSYKGMLYQATTTATASGTGVYDDTGVSWQRLNEGSFVEAGDASTVCSGAAYTHSDLCITLDVAVTPNQTTLFAARGNFLNWAMSSKFDVEKSILTGGKYNYYDDVMISENRGCSGSSTVKQIQMDDEGTNPGKFLSLGVRGSRHKDDPFHEDRIDSADDTARLEVLAITDWGYTLHPDCQAAITCIVDTGLNGCQSVIGKCLSSFLNSSSIMEDMRPALNNSLQACWQSDINSGIFGNLVSDCLTLYTGEKQPGSNFTPSKAYHPSELRPADGGPYICYGIYDAGVDHMNRVGYMGRVWNAGGTGGMATCDPVQVTDQCSAPYPCYWKYTGGAIVADPSGENFKNEDDGYVYKCTNVKNNGGCFSNAWVIYYKASDGTGECDPSNPMFGSTSNADWEDPTWPDNKDVPAAPGNGILEAIKDYCDSMKVPEVIDPSGSAGKTGETGNAPALLRDSYIMSFLGGQDPLATMKGYIKVDNRPEGVMQSVAQDLRLGVMAFNYVGTATECEKADPNSKVEKYCPGPGVDADGAQLLAELKSGDLVVDENDITYPDNDNKRRHVDDLAQAINDIRATSWTPLGEALYGALGYYTQNNSLCLNCTERYSAVEAADLGDLNLEGMCKDIPGNCLDYPVCINYDAEFNCVDSEPVDDPVQYWCQDNHILVITEGESTADINAAVGGLGTFPVGSGDSRLLSYESTDDLNGDGGGDDTLTGCGDSLYSNTSFDDMTWWGQSVYPLYRNRYIYNADISGLDPEKPKSNIITHVVTTGALTENGTGECNPKELMQAAAVNGGTENYYSGESPDELEENLYAVLGSIMSRASSGSAASVISDSRSGSGAMYQAVFWPEHEDKTNPTPNKVNWVGDVRSLLLDATGRMYEDTVQDGTLNTAEDREIVFYYSGNVKQTRGCYDTVGYRQGPDGIEGTADDFQCRGDLDPEREPCLSDPGNTRCSWVPECTATDDCVETMDVKYLWSANRQLREMDVLADRKIYTWNDVDNNGMVDPDKGEWFQLKTFDPTDTNNYWSTLNAAAATAANRGKVTEDFLTPDDWANFVGLDPNKTPDEMELDAIQSLTRWLLGVDQTDVDDPETDWIDRPLRSRQYFFADTGKTQEWRLGDVIHSAPTAVSKPAEAFNQIYRDPTYTKFSKYWDKRRIVIYFGGNDGMLHAVNGGFYIEDTKQFCCTKPVTVTKTVDGQDVEVEECNDPVTDGECTGTTNLGEELWAYIPYNLQPHLKCLADEYYSHKYFVDKKPRIFDVQIFAEDADHPGGWGTILVGGMRFGGATVDAKDLNDFKDDNGLEDPRQFTSSFFILDITNPDTPQLLGELTRNTDDDYVDLNFTTSTPAMVSMRDGGKDAVTSTWYLVMGNGPSSMDGTNAKGEQGRLAILPLEWLKGPALGWTNGIPSSNGAKEAVRIPNKKPDAKGGGVYMVPLADNAGYISDIISVDYNIDASTEDSLGVRFRTDAVYFGTTDGTWHPEYPNDYYVKSGDQRYWNGGGRLFRLVTKVLDVKGEEMASTPTEWADEWADGNPVRMLADLGAPVVSAPSVGYDGYNYWIYAGTGRFYDELDKTDDGRCLPVNPACLEPQACATSACTSDPACTGTCSDRSNMAYFGIKEPIIDDKNEPAGWSLTSANKVSSFGCDDAVMTWGLIESNLDVSPYITNGLVGANPPNQSLSPDKPSGQRGLMQTDNILVGNKSGYLACWHCRMEGSEYICDNLSDEKCYRGVPAYPVLSLTEDPDSNGPIYDYDKDWYSFEKLTGYIAGTGCEDVNGDRITTGLDGWYHIFHDPRERNISTASLLGDMLYFTSYQPFNDKCKAEGQSFLYGLYYQTGTASADDVIGTLEPASNGSETREKGNPDPLTFDQHKLVMQGLVMPPTLHSGPDGLKAILTDAAGKTSQQEVGDENKVKSGRVNWSDRCSP
ncbi:MAG: hypothetical protein QTN59_02900 [Candidatus Electrothrix communis]|nr:MAG: hypothetical protein QTN59_02900 [Candidatus Electrothrix communis]